MNERRAFAVSQRLSLRMGSVVLGVLILALALRSWSFAGNIDEAVASEMKEHNIHGLSLAIVDHGQIAVAKGFGFTDRSHKERVTERTLFQAGSVSKPIAALGVLRLVELGELTLDEDVNSKLTTWKVPENDFTKSEKVTLRRILSHNAGLTVHGFPGYVKGRPVPTTVEVLDGSKPANTSPVRVNLVPGSRWRYSGGGYTVMQLLVCDLTGKPFQQWMRETVLLPLGMEDSTYEQPLPGARVQWAATGYYANGKEVEGRFHTYPEMAAAGLWTTARDLARAVIGVQRAFSGGTNAVLSCEAARQMLTKQAEGSGLGWRITGAGSALSFSHGGRNDGFDTLVVGYAEVGQGAAILINANDGSGVLNRLITAISKEYGWPEP